MLMLIMKIILSNNVKSLTGMLGRGYGYHIKHRKNGFFGERNSNGSVPPYGHWLFIAVCAELAQIGLHIVDIEVTRNEIADALSEAGENSGREYVLKDGQYCPDLFNAQNVLNLRKILNL